MDRDLAAALSADAPLLSPTLAPVSLARPWAKQADGAYRATLADGRGVWVWSPAPGEWRYGLLSGCEDVPNTYGAPRLHLAKADCLALAGWLRPGARPARPKHRPRIAGRIAREWQVHPVTGEGAELHNPPAG